MIFACALFLSLSLTVGTDTYAETKAPVKAVDAVGMTVSDMDRATDFYSNVLSFEKISDTEVLGEEYDDLNGIFGVRMRIVRMKLGEETIEITEYLTPKGKPFPAETRSNDRWFQHIAIVVSDMDKAYVRLRRNKVQHASTAPQTLPEWNRAAAGIKAFYFRDPDGHFLEIIQFPQDKGDPRWQNDTGRLFLGIDHTAIVVTDTDESLDFYRDLLGFKVAGESLNYGTEQEHLNHVEGTRVRITALRAPDGPGIEFLEYLSPGDGRVLPADAQTNDILNWETTLTVEDAAALARTLCNGERVCISPGPVELNEGTLGYGKAFLVRDPDGHIMEIVEK